MRVVGLGVAVALLATACGDQPQEMDFGGEDIGEERFAILSRGGEIEMGLTDRYVFFALSDSARAEVGAELDRELGDGEGVGGMIGGALRSGVEKAVSFRARYPIEAIEDIRWEDGRMRVIFAEGSGYGDGSFGLDRSVREDDRPLTESFQEQDVRRFGEEFRRVKQGGG